MYKCKKFLYACLEYPFVFASNTCKGTGACGLQVAIVNQANEVMKQASSIWKQSLGPFETNDTVRHSFSCGLGLYYRCP